MDTEFLGTGWAFPPGIDDSEHVSLANGEEDIEQAIRLVLGTVPGERAMRPEFGCGVHDYVFETFGSATSALVETAVEEALLRWEPRIDVVGVSASLSDEGGGARLTVEIDYRVRSTNSEFNLVYPFYLEER
ncbi:GPW/gp25 family protein [Halogeometricum limi]|uniref:IraD/Gp25-like domain-containing protein n=1 Tax=Halogeometricum limi TaxID=555875 RepID=A0A1I6IEP7_9EURY|nr:GPW/gp25 family protein [Halogeometricum limi]SFR65171.1 hypothetical protein SAMN04488124_3152 [Halogeometricum limi]